MYTHIHSLALPHIHIYIYSILGPVKPELGIIPM